MADKTGKNVCLHGTHVLVGEAAINQDKYYILHVEVRMKDKTEKKEMKCWRG